MGAYVDEQRSLGRLETEASQENVLEALAAAVENDRNRVSKRGRNTVVGFVVLLAVAAGLWFGVRPLTGRDPGTAGNKPVPPAPVVAQQPEPVQQESETSAVDDPAPSSEPAERLAGTTQPAEPSIVTEAEEDAPAPVETAALEETERQPAERAVAEPVQHEPAPVIQQPQDEAVTALPSLSVSESGVGTDVRQRALVGQASEFQTGTMVVFWNRVLGGEPGRHIRHVWFYEGNVHGSRELTIGASHWRTYSKQTVRRDGNWAVEAQDEQGRVLARETFVARSGNS